MQLSPPLTGSTSDRGSKSRMRLPRPWLVVPIILALVIGLSIWQWQVRATPAAPTTTQATQGTLILTVSGSGSVQAARTVDLPFQQTGQIQSVDVKVGDHVSAGQTLARIDPTDLQLQLQQAQANLDAAKAQLSQAEGQGATPQDLAIAKAQLASAQAGLTKAQTGNVSGADIQSAHAQLASAQARLDALKHPSQATISAAQLKLDQAQTQLQTVQTSDSQAKTNAQIALQSAVDSLTQAQSRYSTALQNWQHVQNENTDPIQPKTSTGSPNKLTDGQRQQYYDTFVQAQAALDSAQNAVQQAQVTYDAARQKEAAEVPQAQQQVTDAQAQLNALLNPSADDLTQAQATVTQAQAALNKLTQGGSAPDITQAQAQVTQAEANLTKLTAPAADATLAQAKAAVAQAEVQLASAQRANDQATLTAPFAGDIAAVNIVPGETVSSGTAAVQIVDRSALSINLSLSEIDAAKVQVGQPVQIRFDALPEATLIGKVTAIAPSATVQQNVVTYLVQVAFDAGSTPVKPGMSASADIQVQEIKDALLVPSRAVQTANGGATIQVLGQNNVAVPVRVQTGATSNGQTEITACVDTGNLCLRPGDTIVLPSPSVARTSSNSGFGGNRGPVGLPFGGGR